MTRPYALVVGAVNMDICGRPFAPPVMGDSNPGRVSFSPGGVGRNIAHNLRLLGVPVRFLTALGSDHNAGMIKASCAELGIDISRALALSGGATSTYLYITDQRGDMVLAVSDTDVSQCITPEYLSSCRAELDDAAVVVIDGNLTPETIAWLGENCRAPLFADPVSAAKAPRLMPAMPYLHTLKPNRIEAEVLTGVKIDSEAALETAVERLLDMGVRRVFLSLGADGVYCAEGKQRLKLPVLDTALVNANGAGDAFMAALAWSQIEGLDLGGSAAAGLAAASAALETDTTINPALSTGLLRGRMKNVKLPVRRNDT